MVGVRVGEKTVVRVLVEVAAMGLEVRVAENAGLIVEVLVGVLVADHTGWVGVAVLVGVMVGLRAFVKVGVTVGL
jgi:hypothetical protein